MKIKENVQIRKVGNGYVAVDDQAEKEFETLDDVFRYLLSAFEGRSRCFAGESYGNVKIIRRSPFQTN